MIVSSFISYFHSAQSFTMAGSHSPLPFDAFKIEKENEFLHQRLAQLERDRCFFKGQWQLCEHHIAGLQQEVKDLRDQATHLTHVNDSLTAHAKSESARADLFYKKFRRSEDQLWRIRNSRHGPAF